MKPNFRELTFRQEQINKVFDYIESLSEKHDKILFLSDANSWKTSMLSKLALIKLTEKRSYIIYITNDIRGAIKIFNSMIIVLSGDDKRSIIRHCTDKKIDFHNDSVIEFYDYINLQVTDNDYDLMIIDDGLNYLKNDLSPYKKVIYITNKKPLKKQRILIENNKLHVDNLLEDIDLKYRNLKLEKIIKKINDNTRSTIR